MSAHAPTTGGLAASALASLQRELKGLLKERPFGEVVDIVHERLLCAGVSEVEALELNRELRALVQPRYPKFRTFEFFLTRYCNLDCPYCFVHSKNLDRMPQPTADAAIDFILDQWDHDSFVDVIFMGGEPTSAFPAIRHVVHRIEAAVPPDPKKYRFDITTNATLLTEEMMQYFSEHNVKVLISLDGDRETQDLKRRTVKGEGTFDTIVAKLPMIKRYQRYLGTRMTPTPETVHNLSHDVKRVVQLGFRKLIIGPATGIEWPEAALETLREESSKVLRWKAAHPERDMISLSLDEVAAESASCGQDNRWGCRAGRTGLAIDVDGSIFPCSKIIGVDKPRGSQMLMGNVREGITNRDLHARLNGFVPVERMGCWTCGLRTSCHGGCYAANIEATGNPFKPGGSTCDVAATMVEMAQQQAEPEERMAAQLAGQTKSASAG